MKLYSSYAKLLDLSSDLYYRMHGGNKTVETIPPAAELLEKCPKPERIFLCLKLE